ncbi:hypothetical protein Tco_1380516, partial [Tanacetum coccineum]
FASISFRAVVELLPQFVYLCSGGCFHKVFKLIDYVVRSNKMIHRLVMALHVTFHPLNLGWQRSTILGHPMLDGQISRAQSRKEKDGSQNAHLYLDVFEKYTQFCKGSLQQHLSITFEDSMLDAQISRDGVLVDLLWATGAVDFRYEETANHQF